MSTTRLLCNACLQFAPPSATTCPNCNGSRFSRGSILYSEDPLIVAATEELVMALGAQQGTPPGAGTAAQTK